MQYNKCSGFTLTRKMGEFELKLYILLHTNYENYRYISENAINKPPQ